MVNKYNVVQKTTAHMEILTGSFDLFLCRLVPHMSQSKDSIVILILKREKPKGEDILYYVLPKVEFNTQCS